MSKETKLSTADFAGIIAADGSRENWFVSIDLRQLPATSDFAVRVFINLPSADRNTPTTDPHYAGSFGFFGTTEPSDRPGHKHQPQFSREHHQRVAEAEEHSADQGRHPISVQLVPAQLARNLKRGYRAQLEKIEIITTPVIINPPRERYKTLR